MRTATKKPASNKTATKATKETKPKGPGVIASVLEFLTEASAKAPVTKEDLVNRLAKRFPDRPKESMAKTVNVQVPGRLSREQGVNVVKAEDGGFYIKK
jgi:hypothetical protein